MGRQRAVLGGMAAALVLLLVSQVLALSPLGEPRTVTALRYDGEPPIYVTGTVIRQELPIRTDRPGDWLPQVSDGAAVAAGETLLVREPSPAMTAAARTLRLLRQGDDWSRETALDRRGLLHRSIAGLESARGADRVAAAETLTALALGEAAVDEPALTRAERALLDLRGEDLSVITAPVAGVFAAAGDGLETVLTPEDPWADCPLPAAPWDPALLGRLITSDTWYVRLRLPFPVEPGDRLTVMLLGGIQRQVTMTVAETAGEQTLLSCDRLVSQVAALRQLTLRLPSQEAPGVEIPAEALVEDDAGETGVWCLVGEAAVRKPVTVIKELGDTVVVALDQSTTTGLWPGDEIILDRQ